MTILCATNFSNDAQHAEHTAAALALRLQEPLALVHVRENYLASTELERERDCDKLSERGAYLRHRYRIQLNPILFEGTPARAVVEQARELAVRLIVVGSRDNIKAHCLLGSVAERVAQTASVPVLVVRDSLLLESWLNHERRLKVLVGTSMDQTSKRALDLARQLDLLAPCDLTVAHVVWPFSEQAKLGIHEPVRLDRLLPEVEANVLAELRAWATPVPESTRYVALQGLGRVDSHLSELGAQLDVGLVIVGARQQNRATRLWHGSVSRGVLHYSRSNVLCVPDLASH